MSEDPAASAPPYQKAPTREAPAERTLIAGSALGVALKTLASIAGYAGVVLAARLLGTDDFGLYTLSLATVTMLSVVTSGGIENTLVRLIPSRRSVSPREAVRTLNLSLQNVLIGGTLVAALCAVFSVQLATALGQPSAAPLLRIMVWALPCIGLLAGTRAANRSVYAFRAALMPTFVVQPVIGALALAIILAWGGGNASIVAAVYAGGAAIAAVVAVWVTCLRPEFGVAWLRPRLQVDKEAVRISSTFLAINLITNLKSSGLVFIIGWWLTERDLGLFGAASRTAALTAFILTAVNITFAPVISTLWSQKATNELVAAYRKTTRWTLAVSAPACMLLIVCAPGILRLFGPQYVPAASALAWLSIGQLVNAGVGSVGFMLMMTGRQRLMLWDTVCMTLASLAAAFIVAPRFGFVGVAVVGGVANALFNLIMLQQVWRQLGALPYDKRTLNVAVAIVAAVAAGVMVARIPPISDASWMLFTAVQAGAMLAVYATMVVAFGLTPAEKHGFVRACRRMTLRQASDAR
jgi:O-antigen/teichoic acid export membrane protein